MALTMTATSISSWSRAPATDRQVAEGGQDPSPPVTGHADEDALEGDLTGPAGDGDRLGEPIQSVDGDDDVGGLGRGGGAAGAHRDTDVRPLRARARR